MRSGAKKRWNNWVGRSAQMSDEQNHARTLSAVVRRSAGRHGKRKGTLSVASAKGIFVSMHVMGTWMRYAGPRMTGFPRKK